MTDRPIMFSASSIHPILADTKTCTRRLITPQPVVPVMTRPLRHAPKHAGPYFDAYCGEKKTPANPHGMGRRWCWWTADDRPDPLSEIPCPYGVPGDRLWVKETWSRAHPDSHDDPQAADGRPRGPEMPDGIRPFAYYAATDTNIVNVHDDDRSPWKSPIFMPRWASRILLEVTDIKVERLHAITDDEAKAEGVEPFFKRFPNIGREQCITTREFARDAEYRASFACTWDEINGNRALWITNPWVWVVAFRRVAQQASEAA